MHRKYLVTRNWADVLECLYLPLQASVFSAAKWDQIVLSLELAESIETKVHPLGWGLGRA